MKLYKLSQDENKRYDSFDSCIVCAIDEDDAKSIRPMGGMFLDNDVDNDYYSTWAYTKDSITCEEIGTPNDSQKRGVILASFNAG